MTNENIDAVVLSDETALEELKKGYAGAEMLLKDEDRFGSFLEKLEKKLQIIPAVGKGLSHIPIMVSMIRSYAKKEYTEIPMGTIVAVVSALTYWLSPVDLIPDFIPGAGLVDDGMVIVACINLIDSDVKEYIAWRDKRI